VRKGMDFVMWRKVVTNISTGEVEESSFWARPAYGTRELARRRKANRAARLARRRNRGR